MLDKVKLFVCTAETLNITVAGKRLNMEQADASRQITSLEKAWGVLFERNPLRLTELGAALLPVARQLLHRHGEIETIVERFRRGSRALGREVVQIGVNETIARTWLPSWQRGLDERLGSAKPSIEILRDTSINLSRRARDEALSLSVCTVQVGKATDKHVRLDPFPMVFAGHADLGACPRTLDELARRGLSTWQRDSLPAADLTRLLAAHRLDGADIEWHTDISAMIESALDRGRIATLPREVVEASDNQRLRVLCCDAKLPDLPMWFSWADPEDCSDAVRLVAEDLLAFIATAGGREGGRTDRVA